MIMETEIKFSGSKDGEGILVTSETEPVLIHEASSVEGTSDSILLYVSSSVASDVITTFQIGNSTMNIATSEINTSPVSVKFVLQNGVKITATASVPDVITVLGIIIRSEEMEVETSEENSSLTPPPAEAQVTA